MKRTATVLIAATGFCGVAAPALAAPGDPVTGYWSRTNPGLPVPVQAPDTVPEGGTWVSSDPAGPVAVSALRTGIAEGLVAVELRLKVADKIGTPAVQACPSSDAWAPEQGGRLQGAPDADCTAPIETKIDGDVLVVPLPPGLDVINVLLRPVPGTAFSLTMERATAASVVTAPEPAPFTAPPPLPLGPPPMTGSGPAFESAQLPPFGPAADVAAPPLLAVPELPAPVAAAAAPAPQAAPAPVTLAVPAARPLPAAVPDRTPTLLAVAVLVLLGMQAARLASQPAVAPRALGGSARRSRPVPEAEALQVLVPARGVGRFRTQPVLGVRTPPARGVGRFQTVRVHPPVRI